MFVIKYSKSVYEQKLVTMEGYLSQLESSLDNLQNLKESMFQFWSDDRAREAAELLNEEIRQVRNAHRRTQDFITQYKSVITYMEGSDDAIGDLMEGASSALEMLGL